MDKTGLFRIGEIMKSLGVSRRRLNYIIEVLCLEPAMWRSGNRLFSMQQIEQITEKITNGKRTIRQSNEERKTCFGG